MNLFLSFTLIFSVFLFDKAMGLEKEETIPDVIGVNQLQQSYSFKDQASAGYLLVFFYPRANTPGCTAQNKSLRDQFKSLNEKGIKVVGVSTDSVAKQNEFHKSLGLPFPLVSDEKELIAKAFGVPVRLGFASRQAFLFKNGKAIWVDHNAATSAQADDVLKAVALFENK